MKEAKEKIDFTIKDKEVVFWEKWLETSKQSKELMEGNLKFEAAVVEMCKEKLKESERGNNK